MQHDGTSPRLKQDGVDLSVAEQIKVLGVVLDRRLID